jgi:hypothetical protein
VTLGPDLDAPAPKPASGLGGLLSSLLLLGAVFFFINSACARRSSDGDSVECRVSLVPPERASVEIVAPADGATVSSEHAGLVPVPVELAATGVNVRPASICAQATGFFRILVEPFDVPDCGPLPSRQQLHKLTDGEKQRTLMLAPGRYTLNLQLGLADGRTYDGLVDKAQITVVGVPGDAGTAVCR